MTALNDSMRQFLKGRHYAVLATHNEDGSAHLTPIWYLFENDRFFFGSASSSRKARNVLARPKAAVVIDIRRPGAERWVSASGTAEIVRGKDSQEINARILRRYMTDEAVEDPRIGPVFAAADDITICLVPSVFRSWEARDLDARFFGGILTSTPEKWFRPLDG